MHKKKRRSCGKLQKSTAFIRWCLNGCKVLSESQKIHTLLRSIYKMFITIGKTSSFSDCHNIALKPRQSFNGKAFKTQFFCRQEFSNEQVLLFLNKLLAQEAKKLKRKKCHSSDRSILWISRKCQIRRTSPNGSLLIMITNHYYQQKKIVPYIFILSFLFSFCVCAIAAVVYISLYLMHCDFTVTVAGTVIQSMPSLNGRIYTRTYSTQCRTFV